MKIKYASLYWTKRFNFRSAVINVRPVLVPSELLLSTHLPTSEGWTAELTVGLWFVIPTPGFEPTQGDLTRFGALRLKHSTTLPYILHGRGYFYKLVLFRAISLLSCYFVISCPFFNRGAITLGIATVRPGLLVRTANIPEMVEVWIPAIGATSRPHLKVCFYDISALC